MDSNTNYPVVSISCATYNHEKYIRETLEGFLMQRTQFRFEILINDDASTDGTPNIVREYEHKYPDLIFPLYQKENQYSKGIIISPTFNWPRARGRYIALCEGDDYWTDPLKLQKQVDFLEDNSDYGMVHTNFDMYYQNSGVLKRNYHNIRNSVCEGDIFENLLFDNTIATLTVMFRSNFLKKIDLSQMSRFKMGDKYLWLEIARRSKIGYINESTGVYRILSKSVSNHFGGSKRIDFILSSYKLNYYFIDKYGCSIETREKVFRKAINTWFSLNEKECFNESYNRLLNTGHIKISDRLKNIAINNLLVSLLYRWYKNTKISLKKLKNGIQK